MSTREIRGRLTWISVAACKRIAGVTQVAATNRAVVDHLAFRVDSATSSARVYALLVDASLVQEAL